MLSWAFENLPEDLLAPGRLFPAQRVVMLAATSKRVRGLLGRLQRRVPLALQMRRRASMESVASALPGMLAWCSVVRLDMSRCGIRAEGARTLAGVLGQCSSLAVLILRGNDIGAEGAGRLAGVLGQCSSLAHLDLRLNRIGSRDILRLVSPHLDYKGAIKV